MVRYKAHLVAQGFSQVPGVDYFDTFAPVAKLASIHVALAIAAANNMEIHQIDIKGAYLNRKLNSDEQIYMAQPPGYHAPNSVGLVCRLIKTLYGLKQSRRRWYQQLVEIMESLKFKRSDMDQAVFYQKTGSHPMVILVHVDDCTIIAAMTPLIHAFKAEISRHVEITDLGKLHWLLGIEIKRDREAHTIQLSQHAYILSILCRYNMDNAKPISIPMDPSTRLSTALAPTTPDEYAKMVNILYHEAVGSLMYCAIGTRPDIAYAVQTVSCFPKTLDSLIGML